MRSLVGVGWRPGDRSLTPVVLRGRWEIPTMQRATPASGEIQRAPHIFDKKDPARELAALGLGADLSAAKRVSFNRDNRNWKNLGCSRKNGVARAA